MKTAAILMIAVLLTSCATHSTSYKRLPERYTTIAASATAETFVFEINPAFEEPVGYRFEFFPDTRARGVKTMYPYRGAPVTTELREQETVRIRKALLAFDWNHIEQPKDSKVFEMVLDDIGILFRARLGGIYHEASVGLSSSGAIKELLREIEIIE